MIASSTRKKQMIPSELLEQLKKEDEVTILELLEITTEELVDAFADRIDEHRFRLYRFYE